MKKTLLICCLLLFANVHAQDTLNPGMVKKQMIEADCLNEQFIQCVVFEMPECPFNVESAQTDILKNTMSVVIHGGFTGFGNMNQQLTERFQQKYQVQFYYLGCVRFWDSASEDTDGYNQTIFSHLEQQYGKIVRKEFEQLWKHD